MKNLLFFSALTFLLFSCKNDKKEPVALTQINGETMGTYYKVTVRDSLQRNFKPAIDSVLIAVNKEVNTYDSTSTISIFNRLPDSLDLQNNVFSGEAKAANNNKHFITNLLAAKQVHAETDGDFDPTVMPLVNYWGFGYTPKKAVVQADSVKIDSLMQMVGFDKIIFRQDEEAVIGKTRQGVMLDFSALAKGYGVDAVARYLSRQNLTDYYVEIGGESYAQGNGSTGNGWTVAVAVPQAGKAMTDAAQIIRLKNQAIATSGNYINFYEVDGKKYAHTINPKTGYPEANTLLSASIFTDECMMSDAYATACMVMGLEKAKALLEKLPGVEGLLIYSDAAGELQTYVTKGAQGMVVE